MMYYEFIELIHALLCMMPICIFVSPLSITDLVNKLFFDYKKKP